MTHGLIMNFRKNYSIKFGQEKFNFGIRKKRFYFDNGLFIWYGFGKGGE